MGTPTDSAAKRCTGMGRSSHRTSAKIVRVFVKVNLASSSWRVGLLHANFISTPMPMCIAQSAVSEPRVYTNPQGPTTTPVADHLRVKVAIRKRNIPPGSSSQGIDAYPTLLVADGVDIVETKFLTENGSRIHYSSGSRYYCAKRETELTGGL